MTGTVAGLSDGEVKRRPEPHPTGTVFIPSDDGGVRKSRWHGSNPTRDVSYPRLRPKSLGRSQRRRQPHGRRASRVADVARDEVDGGGWNPAMRALLVPGEEDPENAGLGELYAVSAVVNIAFKPTLQSPTTLDIRIWRIVEQQMPTSTP